MLRIFITAFIIAAVFNHPPAPVEIRGIYGHPQKLWDAGHRLDSLGVNAIFLHDKSISPALMTRARNEGAKVYAEFATLNGKGYVDNHPEAWAIDNFGNKVKAATWFMGVCPTDPGFRQYREDELKKLLRTFDIDGLWMDYVHWHAQFEDPEPILPETCFCNKCTSRFSEQSGVSITGTTIPQRAEFILKNHDSAWREWRCKVVEEWAADFRAILKKEKPGALLGLYHCPWNDADFDGARYRILGIDYKKLAAHIDVFSPMVYHERMGRKPEWVKENIEWFSNIVKGPKIWPIVQASNDPGKVSPQDFEKVLRYGLSGNASGVMMFTTDAVASDAAKIEIMKKVYGRR